jgi:hypothetical protein
MISKRLALLWVGLPIAVAACGDITRIPASLPILADSTSVYAINGSPPGAPTALFMYIGQVVPADPSFRFDIAFDIDASGGPVLLPVRTVANVLSSSFRVGLRNLGGIDYATLAKAPSSGFRYDSTLAIHVGDVVVIQSSDPAACSASLSGTTIYGKIIIDAIDLPKRQLTTRFVVDPNCGFLSLTSGIPKE